VRLVIRIHDEGPDEFSTPEWDWCFEGTYLNVWKIDYSVCYRYPYTTIYRTELHK